MAETTATATKAAKKNGFKLFFKGVKSEFNRITWPTKENLTKETIAVVILSVLLGAIIALLDLVIKFGIDKIIV